MEHERKSAGAGATDFCLDRGNQERPGWQVIYGQLAAKGNEASPELRVDSRLERVRNRMTSSWRERANGGPYRPCAAVSAPCENSIAVARGGTVIIY